jgi:exonuclease SbcC
MDQTQRKLDGLATRQQNIENLLDETAQKQKGEVDAESAALKLLNEKIEPWQMTATLETARSVLQNLQTLKTTYLQKKENADSLQNKVNNAAVDRANLVSDLNVTDDTLKKSQGKVQELSTKIETALATWFSNVRMEEVDALIAGLEKKNTSWKKNQDDMLKAERDLEKDLASVAQFEENLKQVQSRRDEMSAQFESTKQGLEKNEELRKDLFGEKSVDDERNKARSLRDTAERLANEARGVEQQKRDAKMALDNSIADLNRRIAETEPKLSENQQQFLENLAAKNFANEEEFKAAKLPEMERKSLQQTQKRVDDNLTAAQTSVKNFNDQLVAHLQKRNFEDSEESATQNREAAKTKLAECNLNFGTWTEQKRNDDLKRQQFADLQTQLTTLQEKRGDWLQMQCWFNGNNARTGNGDVFVKFIQSITLRNLLKIANGYLHDMFPRYEMVAAKETLDIMLIDHDNSDAIRPIKNISGGEGFIVSLSLALGISTIASQNVSIDSLFLDEGFGTLDTKMLQETVVVLQKMQQERGKLLGVITHLDLVKNELQTHIEVTPRGGRSFLSGAGVSNG